MRLFNPIDIVVEDLLNDLPIASEYDQLRLGERVRHLRDLNKLVQARQLGMEMRDALRHVQLLENEHCSGFQYGCEAKHEKA